MAATPDEKLVNEAIAATRKIAGFMHRRIENVEAAEKLFAQTSPEALQAYISTINDGVPSIEKLNANPLHAATGITRANQVLLQAEDAAAKIANPQQQNSNSGELNLRNGVNQFFYGKNAYTSETLLHPTAAQVTNTAVRTAANSSTYGLSYMATGISSEASGLLDGKLLGWNPTPITADHIAGAGNYAASSVATGVSSVFGGWFDGKLWDWKSAVGDVQSHIDAEKAETAKVSTTMPGAVAFGETANTGMTVGAAVVAVPRLISGGASLLAKLRGFMSREAATPEIPALPVTPPAAPDPPVSAPVAQVTAAEHVAVEPVVTAPRPTASPPVRTPAPAEPVPAEDTITMTSERPQSQPPVKPEGSVGNDPAAPSGSGGSGSPPPSPPQSPPGTPSIDEWVQRIGSSTTHAAEDNKLYGSAVDVVVQNQKGSTSFLQRQLNIGYNQATRLMERMQNEGVVSAADNVGKREVLLKSGRPPETDTAIYPPKPAAAPPPPPPRPADTASSAPPVQSRQPIVPQTPPTSTSTAEELAHQRLMEQRRIELEIAREGRLTAEAQRNATPTTSDTGTGPTATAPATSPPAVTTPPAPTVVNPSWWQRLWTRSTGKDYGLAEGGILSRFFKGLGRSAVGARTPDLRMGKTLFKGNPKLKGNIAGKTGATIGTISPLGWVTRLGRRMLWDGKKYLAALAGIAGVGAVGYHYLSEPEDTSQQTKTGTSTTAPASTHATASTHADSAQPHAAAPAASAKPQEPAKPAASSEPVKPAVSSEPAKPAASSEPVKPAASSEPAKAATSEPASLKDLTEAITRAEKSGNYGANLVTEVQKLLKKENLDLGTFGATRDGIDGKFGAYTQTALATYLQKAAATDPRAAQMLAAIKKAQFPAGGYNNKEFASAFGIEVPNDTPTQIAQTTHAPRHADHKQLALATTGTAGPSQTDAPAKGKAPYNKVAMSPTLPAATLGPVMTADNDHRPKAAPANQFGKSV